MNHQNRIFLIITSLVIIGNMKATKSLCSNFPKSKLKSRYPAIKNFLTKVGMSQHYSKLISILESTLTKGKSSFIRKEDCRPAVRSKTACDTLSSDNSIGNNDWFMINIYYKTEYTSSITNKRPIGEIEAEIRRHRTILGEVGEFEIVQ